MKKPLLALSACVALVLGAAHFRAAGLSAVVDVSTVAQLEAAVASLMSGQVIRIAAGRYAVTQQLRIRNGVTNVALVGATGNRDDVVIVGSGMNTPGVNIVIKVENAQDVRLADLSVGEAFWHPIQLQGEQGAERVHVSNVRLFDAGQQFLKSTVDYSSVLNGVDDVIVENSLIEFTVIGPPDGYTEGIDVHHGANWIIRNNVFRNFRVPVGASYVNRPCVLMWGGSRNSTVSGNRFLNCERAIIFGQGGEVPGNSHSGGIIANNFIYRTEPQHADAGISVWDSPGTRVFHNTVIQNGTYPAAIEYRFASTTGVEIINNLTDGLILQRDGASAVVLNNYTAATPSLFVNPAGGDLHLLPTATVAIDQGRLVGIAVDWDVQARPIGAAPDLGADEQGAAGPAGEAPQSLLTTQVPAVSNYTDGTTYELGVSLVSNTAGQITAIRYWKPPSDSGPHVGRIWSAGGVLLASVTFAGETASGWQQQALTTPLSIAANTEYVVSVPTGPAGYLVATLNAFPLANGHLQSVGSRYAPVGSFPANPSAHNYFRDIVFVPDGGAPDTTPPTVSITQPAPGSTVSGLVTIAATAADNVGVAGVQFKVDGVNFAGEVTSAPYSVVWNSTAVSNGSHELTAIARDAAGHTTPASVTVTVNNAGSGPGPQTLVTTQEPAIQNYTDGTTYELGVRLVSDTAGQITAIRYWKAPSDSGSHAGRIWSAAGVLLASVTFTGETASGWQQQALSTPLSIAANTEYVVSVPTGPTGYLVATLDAFPLTNGHLQSPGSRYAPVGSFPANPSAHNYFRDVVFVPDGGGGPGTPGPQTLLTTQVPAIQNYTDGTTYELGVRLISDIAGQITAIRYWKPPSDSGTHVGRIWSAGGLLLTSVTFTGETASGWQQQALTTPLSIAANTEYVVSVPTGPAGYLVATLNAFPLANGHLHSAGGRYAPVGNFPANPSANNYFRDVVFVPDGAATQPQLTPILSGLSSPLFVGHAGDGSNRLFIVERAGVIKVLQPGATTPTVFLNITSKVLSGGEQGLLGLAFHPLYESNGRFFVFYTRGGGELVVAEYRVSANANVAAPTEEILLTIPHGANTNHNGGMLAFGPDNYLYIGVGDGGGANDLPNNAQNLNVLLGKILRIDIDVPEGQTYVSPPSNPFAGAASGRDEIFAYGMRNPWRFSFDRALGHLWVADVGQGAREEVNSPIVGGGNYGWRIWEGFSCTTNDPPLCGSPASYIFPVFDYQHTGGRCSITGGYVYRGLQGAVAGGTYVYGDFCSGEIFGWTGGPAQPVLLNTTLNIASFGEDESGELYVVGLGGTVSKIVSAPLPPPS